MTRVWLLVFGVIATIGFAAVILVGIPRVILLQIPVPAELEPYSESELRGRQVYIANGCVYCHSQQLRDDAFTTDVERGWGDRPSVPSDYVYDAPQLLGTMRTGPDLINVGLRLPSREWHLLHLYNPRAVVEWSIMPAYPYLFEERDPADVGSSDVVVPIQGRYAPQGGRVVVAKPDAIALVDYLLSLRRGYPVPGQEGAAGPGGPGAPGASGTPGGSGGSGGSADDAAGAAPVAGSGSGA